MIRCPKCGNVWEDDALICLICGQVLQEDAVEAIKDENVYDEVDEEFEEVSEEDFARKSSGDTIIKLARNYFIGSVLIAIAGAIVGFVWMSWDELGIGWIIVGASVLFAIYGWLIKVLVSSYGEMVSDTNRTKQHAAACEAYLKRIAEKLDK